VTRVALAGAAAAALLAAGGASAADPGAALERLLRDRALRGARIGVAVERMSDGARVLAHEAQAPLVPASNQKLLVAAAALSRLGPEHRIETPVWTDGELDAQGVLNGALWVEGRGDPGLVSEELWRLAEAIRLRGVREVRGGIGVDASWFDGARLHPDWEPTSARAYEAPTSAFAANYSSFRVEVEPGTTPGAPGRARVAPRVDYLALGAEVATLDRPGALAILIEPLPAGGGERVRVRGAIGRDAQPKTYWRAVAYPERYAASVLAAQLAAQGVRVVGGVRLGARPPDARELLRHRGERLDALVARMNKWSNNFVAEQLCKLLGAEAFGPPGDWEKGTRAVREALVALGIDDRSLVIADGSGLSARNRVTAAALVALVRAAGASFAWGPEFLASLPLGGRDGTLEDRMQGEAPVVRAKTGHLRHAASLSGVALARDGERLAFSVIVNGARGGWEDVDAAIDAFVAALGD
jgi:D-alanyl-D-alanine carboxypeptidase/D-alanyl-D-alanine-endopeptidase (penicillin-binding protein 4)